MDTVRCSHCNGSGKELDSISLTTGEVGYRTCSVCQGSGVVSVDKQHFTQYPDVSLRNAIALMQQHGKPVEVSMAANDDVELVFPDGSRYLLGGFATGYRGTGPDFFKRLLEAAGFAVSTDDIADMQPPLTFKASQAPAASPPPQASQAPTATPPPKAPSRPDRETFAAVDDAALRSVERWMQFLPILSEQQMAATFESCYAKWGAMSIFRGDARAVSQRLGQNVAVVSRRAGYDHWAVSRILGEGFLMVSVRVSWYLYPHHIWRLQTDSYALYPAGILGGGSAESVPPVPPVAGQPAVRKRPKKKWWQLWK
jgi:hypothetical protein